MNSPATIRPTPTMPFKGLAHYTEADAGFFFGRERERDVVVATLKARRLTLLYGESGVGQDIPAARWCGCALDGARAR